MGWAVVQFTNENAVEAVPAAWFMSNCEECFWPPAHTKRSKIVDFIKYGDDPKTDWKAFQLFYDFKTAQRKASKAQITSELSSNSEAIGSVKGRGHRKPIKNRRIMDSITPSTFYGKTSSVVKYKIRDIPNGSSDSELSDDDIEEPTSIKIFGNLESSDEESNSSDPEDNVPLSRIPVTSKTNLAKQKKANSKLERTATKQNEGYVRFEVITSNSRGIDKILPVINQIREACLQIPIEECLSCDEQVIPFKGRTSLKTYNPKKPHKWGYKMWVLSGVSGLSYNFELFAGKQGFSEVQNEPDLGAASNVVVRMSRVIPSDKHYKLYYDNYFSSLPLVSYLEKRKIHSVATVRTNRLTGYKGLTEKEMKKSGRGTIEEQTDWILNAQLDDEKCKSLVEVLTQPPKDHEDNEIYQNYRLINNRLYKIVSGKKKWVVPKAARRQVVLHFHDVRWGLNSTMNSTTGKSPYELLFGYAPRGVANAILDNEISIESTRDENLVATREKVKHVILRRKQLPNISTQHCNEQSRQKPKVDHYRYVVEDVQGSSRSQRKYKGIVSLDKLKAYNVEVSSQSEDELDDNSRITNQERRRLIHEDVDTSSVADCEQLKNNKIRNADTHIWLRITGTQQWEGSSQEAVEALALNI
ncbi:hypothetical protein NQ314_015735 [Rhamnusium bicolor]|uniref:PiggyBac transposable element-derived protein domain-containing protein n=1 Tax=Rhamnusium bicolor TaxID=1586634 RepID=A0AAV8WXL4_9CUCU|nr:hypothetical protein NQ314_015735 [Rhamnusium bicolor]